ncbi:hypothetical protein FIA58_003540 [Flavobacterium jejuense]|uniref:DUF4412 domain-containing protein n=1 Tax=Flavobacterium jejuense TaxID=1544455 RepID=A0ABX0ILS0_9FLAO|nr:hypothetical protein [Flavobacterium jejuense]NHN24740.1 hypothetical protein [Flavobacterium jejuense]
MRYYIIIIVLFCLQTNAQNKFKLNIDSFLLGMFDDYNGRYIALDNTEKGTYLATVKSELSDVFLDTLTKYHKIPKNEIKKLNFSFYNKQLAEHFNKYYKIEIEPDYEYIDEKDGKEYSIYNLSLNEQNFDENNKKISFLIGFFYKCGFLESGEVTLKTANSPAFENAIHFISQLGFRYCELERPEYNIPTVQSVTFKPTEEYIEYFK